MRPVRAPLGATGKPIGLIRSCGPRQRPRRPAAAGPKASRMYEEREVTFDGPRGRLAGTLLRLEAAAAAAAEGGSAGRARCVLLCHGYASYRDGFQLPALAEALAGAGYNSFRLDFSGNGASEGTFRFANYVGEVEEIAAAKKHLEQREGQAVVALLGKGGDDVVLYASLRGDIPLVVNVAGRFRMEQGITMRFGDDIFERVEAGPVAMTALRDDGRRIEWQLTQEDLQERVGLDMAAAAASIRGCKVLTVHGTADAVIPFEDGEAFANTIPGALSSLVLVDGADHNFRAAPGLARQLADAVLSFLARHAGAAAPEASAG